MWTAFMKTIAEAGSKEIKRSMDLKDAIAHLTNFFHKLWVSSLEALGSEDTRIVRYGFLLQTAMEQLGPLHFTEKIVTRNAQSMFEAVMTPSSRPRHSGSMQAPLKHLLELILDCSPEEQSIGSRVTLARTLLALGCESRNSRQLKLEYLAECSSIVTKFSHQHGHCLPITSFGQTILELADATFQHTPGSDPSALQSLASEYRDLARVILPVLKTGDGALCISSSCLLKSAGASAKRDVGPAATTILLTEPLSEALITLIREPTQDELNMVMCVLPSLLQCEDPPRNRRVVEQVRQKLGKLDQRGPKPAEFDPYVHFYTVLMKTLTGAYETLHNITFRRAEVLLTQLNAFLQRCALTLRIIVIRKLQAGLDCWIRDPQLKTLHESTEAQALRKAVGRNSRFLTQTCSPLQITGLWCTITDALWELPRRDSLLLRVLGDLMVSALSSRRRVIRNRAVEFWNASFGTDDTITYPHQVRSTLGQLQALVGELRLPNFPGQLQDVVGLANSMID